MIDKKGTVLDRRKEMTRLVEYTKVSNRLEEVAEVDSNLKVVGNNQGEVCRLVETMAAEMSSLDNYLSSRELWV